MSHTEDHTAFVVGAGVRAKAWLSSLAELNPGCHSTRASRRIPILFFHAGTGLLVYAMSSLSRTLCTGVTNDVERHVAEHKEGESGSIAARYNVTRLFHFEQFDDIREGDWPRDRDSGDAAHREDCVNRVDEAAAA